MRYSNRARDRTLTVMLAVNGVEMSIAKNEGLLAAAKETGN